MAEPVIPQDAQPGDTWEHVDEWGTWTARLQDGGAVTLVMAEPTQDYLDAHPAPDPIPNVLGFLGSARGAFGADFWFTTMATFPPVGLIITALDKGDWASARTGIDAMLAASAITQDEYDTLQTLLAQHGIPEG